MEIQVKSTEEWLHSCLSAVPYATGPCHRESKSVFAESLHRAYSCVVFICSQFPSGSVGGARGQNHHAAPMIGEVRSFPNLVAI